MSAGGAFGGARGYQPKAPDKGVFPLDHFGECKQVSSLTYMPIVSPCDSRRWFPGLFPTLS